MSDQPAAGTAAPGLRQNRNWRRLWLGQAVSIVGDYVFDTTVVLWIYRDVARGLVWRPEAVAGALIAAAIPAMLVGPVAGVFVDRWNRRRTMLTADAARVVLIAALLLLPFAGKHLPPVAQLVVLYAVVAAASGFAQFFNPSRFALIGVVVAPEDRASASGLFQATSSFASVIGPPLAAPLLFTAGVQWALIINAASFGISFLAVLGLRVSASDVTRPERTGFLSELRAGIRFFRTSPVLIALAIGVVVATLGSGAIGTLMVFFLTHNLHAKATWLGTLDGAIGAGAIGGALATGWLAKRLGEVRIFWAGLVLAGLAFIVFSRLASLPAALVVLVVLGALIGIVNVAISPLFLAATPQHMMGRVYAVVNPLQYLASIVSMALASVLVGTVLRGLHAHVLGLTFGPYDTIFLVSGLLFVAAGLATIRPLRGASPQPAGPARRCGRSQPETA